MSTTRDIRYSYADVPTLARFAESDARIRGINGPFRSGKSSASVMEIAQRGCAQRPGPDGVARSRWIVVRNCYDDQTEILTERRGWQFFADLIETDRVATLKDGALTFETPTNHYAAHYQGEMVGLKSDGLDLLVTPDHKLWASKRSKVGGAHAWRDYEHVHARDIYGMELFRFKRDATWEGNETASSLDFFEFLGFWMAEGSAGIYRYPNRTAPHWRFNVVQKETGYTRDLLRRAGLRWGETISKESGCTYFRIVVTEEMKPLVAQLSALGGAPTKRVPQWIKEAPSAYHRAFLTGYINGDGSFKAGRPHHVTRVYTASKRLADDVQEMALKAGWVANVGSSAIPAQRGIFKSNSERQYRITILTGARSEPRARGWYKADYDGMVYCLEVSTHVVYVRRNGKAVWCGQTFAQLEDSTIRTVHMWLPPEHFGKYVQRDHTYTIKALRGAGGWPCEIEVWFRALDRPDHVRNLLSVEVTGGWVNEAREVPWPIVEALDGRIGQYPPKNQGGPTWAGLWMDTNPPDVDSKWYRFFEETPHDPMRVAHFHQPSGLSDQAENLSNLPSPSYYKDLAYGKAEAWVKVYIHGQYGFVAEGKPIYPEYKDQVHCVAVDPVPGVRIIRGWDYGLQPACSFSQLLPDGRWLVFDEMTSDNMSIDEFSDNVLEHCARSFRGKAEFQDWGDPAGDQRAQTDKRTCFQIQQGKGIMVEGSVQNVAMRWEAVRKPLRTLVGGEPQFILHPRCRVLRKGFMGAYHRRRLQVSGPERYSEQADKTEASHIHDALQYSMVQYFQNALMNAPEEDDFGRPDFAVDATRSEITGY